MGAQELYDHLGTGSTSVCTAWAVVRRDGVTFGFTDHDRDLNFDGMTFKANSGLTARALQQSTGLSVDNSEATGALSDAAVTEADITAGRFDGAAVQAWMVNWAEVSQRILRFRGRLGEIARIGGAFQAELRGLAEALNVPQGRVYQRDCTAILGDAACGIDLTQTGFFEDRPVEVVELGRVFRFASFTGFDDRWFERGRLRVLSGAATGLTAVVKNDRLKGTGREIELWEELRAPVVTGDLIRIEAGCDKRVDTCRLKFANFPNFRGFPHIPGEDWLSTFPSATGLNDGGSLQS